MEKGGVQRVRVEQHAGPGRRRFVEVVLAETRNKEAGRRGKMWVESRSRNTPREKTHTEHTLFSTLNTEDFSVLYRARSSGEGHAESNVIARVGRSDWL